MAASICQTERWVKVAVGAVLLVLSGLILVLGLNLLPVTGVVLTLPPLITAVLFLAAPA